MSLVYNSISREFCKGCHRSRSEIRLSFFVPNDRQVSNHPSLVSSHHPNLSSEGMTVLTPAQYECSLVPSQVVLVCKVSALPG